jgi:hypothetical protein
MMWYRGPNPSPTLSGPDGEPAAANGLSPAPVPLFGGRATTIVEEESSLANVVNESSWLGIGGLLLSSGARNTVAASGMGESTPVATSDANLLQAAHRGAEPSCVPQKGQRIVLFAMST